MTQSPSRSGVFQAATDKRLEAFSESISFDHRLYAQDIRGSIAHARMLCRQKLISPDELAQIESALGEIKQLLDEGKMPFRQELEDIHMHIEQALIERLGDVGRKLHTARSRNDQVSTDLRLWTRDALDRLDASLLALQRAFLSRCQGDMDVVLPAYTHLQRAQPVLAPHYWLAYVEKLARDRQRLPTVANGSTSAAWARRRALVPRYRSIGIGQPRSWALKRWPPIVLMSAAIATLRWSRPLFWRLLRPT